MCYLFFCYGFLDSIIIIVLFEFFVLFVCLSVFVLCVLFAVLLWGYFGL